jgi:hypothetical protein
MKRNILLLTYFTLTSIFITKTDGVITEVTNESNAPATFTFIRNAKNEWAINPQYQEHPVLTPGQSFASGGFYRAERKFTLKPRETLKYDFKFANDHMVYSSVLVESLKHARTFNANDIKGNNVRLNIASDGTISLKSNEIANTNKVRRREVG